MRYATGRANRALSSHWRGGKDRRETRERSPTPSEEVALRELMYIFDALHERFVTASPTEVHANYMPGEKLAFLARGTACGEGQQPYTKP